MHEAKRHPAYKLDISDITCNPYIKTEADLEPNYIDIAGKLKVIRVRLLAKVTFKYLSDDGNYASITLGDGKNSIRVKAWQDIRCLKETEKENLIDIIANVREWNGEVYLVPEVLRKIDDPNLETLRRLEIQKFRKDMGFPEKEDIEKEIGSENKTVPDVPAIVDTDTKDIDDKEKEDKAETLKEEAPAKEEKKPEKEEKSLRVLVLEIIDKLDEGDGADFEDVLGSVKGPEKEVEAIINDFLSEGTCYEPRAGKIKVL
ncbi:hypothetical protein GQ472_00905 [archaeon]|nr:hypothetical protein [archaeon]